MPNNSLVPLRIFSCPCTERRLTLELSALVTITFPLRHVTEVPGVYGQDLAANLYDDCRPPVIIFKKQRVSDKNRIPLLSIYEE